jgi:hypothetical protein
MYDQRRGLRTTLQAAMPAAMVAEPNAGIGIGRKTTLSAFAAIG